MSTAFVPAGWLHMAVARTPNTGWEHPPISGPLVVLRTAVRPADSVIGGVPWATLGAGLCLPAFRVSVPTVAASIASAVAWVGMSLRAAATASA
jgi:hypothetical protein